jgi:tetraacyldisaccharide 4'-kinase
MKFWYQSFSLRAFLLLPLSLIFRLVVAIRYFLFRTGLRKVFHFRVPVIIVGNITVGGTGKTPFVIWLTQFLKDNGFRPGIISRGYGEKKHHSPCLVSSSADPHIVGDEAILLQQHTQCPVMLCIDRVKGVQELLHKTDCNVVISDDGLQHYRLGRDIEIAMVDFERQFGNSLMLPAGPLRETKKRLKKVDFIVENGRACHSRAGANLLKGIPTCAGMTTNMQLVGEECISLLNSHQKIPLENFKNQKVHAVAGIGNPGRFFQSLQKLGLDIIPHVFRDHYLYQEIDLDFKDDLPVLMTEKDAVKCLSFAKKQFWYVPVTVNIDPIFREKILGVLQQCE